jgi:hypothetical protein
LSAKSSALICETSECAFCFPQISQTDAETFYSDGIMAFNLSAQDACMD